MKKAFTMLELIFVIVIIGILAATIVPNTRRNPLQEAAVQVVSHIKYTQHLALSDDKYDSNDNQWFRGRWQIRFFENLSFTSAKCTNEGISDVWAYSIYSDKPGYTRLPNVSELARNPQNKNQFLTGGYNNTICVDNAENNQDEQSMKELRLGEKFDVKDMKFSGGCRSDVRYIQFDHLGRPLNSIPNNPYEIVSNGRPKLLLSRCLIEMCSVSDCASASTDEKVQIAIEPETGYTCILNDVGTDCRRYN